MKLVPAACLVIIDACFAGSAYGATIEPCGSGSVTTGKSYAVNGQKVPLLATPKGAKLINKKATAALHTTQYMSIDNSVTVTEQCTQSGWSRSSDKS